MSQVQIYDDYRDMLLRTCARYDTTYHPRSPQQAPSTRRSTIYMTDVNGPDETTDSDSTLPISINSSFRTRMSGSQ